MAAEDITPSVLYLACDDSRFVTGTTLVVDAGSVNR
jgi:NAD(P)-dependent dehydrogenase (short-subunit alcohol dehydrogenase family)